MSPSQERPPGPESTGPRRALKVAITDVFDEEKKRVLVVYPPRAIRWLTLSGVAAFIITGLFGYARGTQTLFDQKSLWDAVLFILDRVFSKPWPLFLFFCALIFILVGSVLRDPALERYRRSAYIATFVSMIIAVILYIFRPNVGDAFNWVIHLIAGSGGRLRGAMVNPWTYLVINVALLAVVFGQGARRWLRVPGKLLNPPIDLRTGEPVPASPEEAQAGVGEIIAGDLILRAMLTGLLALLFWFPVVSLPARLVTTVDFNNITDPRVFSVCSASLPGQPGTCRYGFAFELWFLDVAIAVLALAVGMLVLAFLLQDEGMRVISTAGDAEPGNTMSWGRAILYTFLDIVLSPFNLKPRSRIGRRVRRNLQGSLRTLVWPCLVFLGVAGAGLLALFVGRAVQSPKFFDPQAAGDDALQNGLKLLGSALLAILGTVFALAAQVGRWRVASNTLRFLRSMAISNALPIMLLSVGLALVNWVLLFLAHLIDLSIHPTGAWSDWRGFDAPFRLHPFYPGVFALSLYAVVLAFSVAVVLSSLLRRRPRPT